MYIIDLTPTISSLTEPTEFAYDTTVTISSKKLDDFCTVSNIVLCHMSKWFEFEFEFIYIP
jgi:hypothetical protein